ncbi:RagB/SusD family nutrient uptake outer membrane protein [Parabacteroides chongii]|uniref:RagB/SusD family nutrient uptake outer membrane protein n=1 Tax=Parabacteroides chongii TaxID=2685834 RepID=UPI00240CF35C|nr:RagB/SusD family nutrient uptake outer membrane protein [Parabacteroides chongii]WFE84258.1 RagB/SusD family nutrient uptake outer membrane protein [Parabacteroides chongii]
MKKNIIGFALMMGLLSCGDSFLDVAPKDKLSDATFWQSEKDVDMALNGCYKGWEAISNVVFMDAASDNGYEQFDYNFQSIGNGQILPTSAPGLNAPWVDGDATRWFRYDRIRKYNNFLEKIEAVEMDADKKERYKAEVRFLRAYDYYGKIMYYGDVPLVDKVITSAEEANLSRTPKVEVEDFVLKELEAVAAVLPVQNTIESGGHITKGAALALKARLELYLGKYEQAQASAEGVINMSCYELYPEYEEMFWPSAESSNKEAILDVQYMKNDYFNMLPQLNLPATEGGWSALNALWPFIEAFQMENGKYIDETGSGYNPNEPFKGRDPRLTKIVLCPGQKYNGRYYNPLDKFIDGQADRKNLDYHEEAAASRGGLLVKKYIYPMSVVDANNHDGNAIVIRLAEMYITFAECALQTGKDKDKALRYINAIRKRAGMPEATELNEKIVRYERRIELAFEGLRYFDLKRWDLGPTLLNGWAIGSRNGTIDSKTGKVTWSDDFIKLEERIFQAKRNYLLPIPQTELDRNPNMKQNPGY